jgi:hypothetical protein
MTYPHRKDLTGEEMYWAGYRIGCAAGSRVYTDNRQSLRAGRVFGLDETGLTARFEKQIFVGKLDGELWASEKNDLRAAISTGILGKGADERVFGRLSYRVTPKIHLSNLRLSNVRWFR